MRNFPLYGWPRGRARWSKPAPWLATQSRWSYLACSGLLVTCAPLCTVNSARPINLKWDWPNFVQISTHFHILAFLSNRWQEAVSVRLSRVKRHQCQNQEHRNTPRKLAERNTATQKNSLFRDMPRETPNYRRLHVRPQKKFRGQHLLATFPHP